MGFGQNKQRFSTPTVDRSLESIAQQDAKKRGKNPDGNSQWDGQNTQARQPSHFYGVGP
jgi:hypothetical protein